MNTYELVVILRPTEKLESLKSKVRDILAKYRAEIEQDEPWGLRTLAYAIDKSHEGYYEFFIVKLNPSVVKDIINEFRLQQDILRYMFVKLPKQKAMV